MNISMYILFLLALLKDCRFDLEVYEVDYQGCIIVSGYITYH
jgi:hypothetical protein